MAPENDEVIFKAGSEFIVKGISKSGSQTMIQVLS